MRGFVPASRGAGVFIVTLAYVLGLGAAWAVAALIPDDVGCWYRLAAADVAGTLAVFVVSFLVGNSSVYDPYWSVAPLAIAAWLMYPPAEARGFPEIRRALTLGVLTAWGLRLTWNWLRGWGGLAHEDFRYVDLQKKTGHGYWLVSLLGLHLMPTVTVFLGLVALGPALFGTAPPSPWDAAGLVIGGGAVLIQAIADAQLFAFRKAKREGKIAADAILARGLWGWTRHPNYLGEVGLWWGMFCFGMAGGAEGWRVMLPGGEWWAMLVGPMWITVLFVAISIPLMDKHMVARRPAYAAHMRRVPGLVPRPWRRAPPAAATDADAA